MTPYKLVDESPKTTDAANAVLDNSGGYADNAETVRPEVIVGHPSPNSTSDLQNQDSQTNPMFVNVEAKKTCCSRGIPWKIRIVIMIVLAFIKVFILCSYYECRERY